MSIVVGLPPVYDEIVLHGITPPDTAVYTYGDTIYNPSGHELPEDLIRHERKHSLQHAAIGAREWWNSWLTSPTFRVEQELAAYQVQYRYFRGIRKDRNEQARFAFFLAQQLSGPMYGRSISFHEAHRRIKE